MARISEPTQAKVLKGNFRPERDSHGPAVDIAEPLCPTWLPRHAKKYWSEIAPELVKYGLISVVDGAAFSVHCDTMGKFQEVTKRLKKLDDMVDLTPKGYQVQSVLFTIRSKLVDQLMKTSREFGLTPAGRSVVKTTGQQQLPLGDWGDL